MVTANRGTGRAQDVVGPASAAAAGGGPLELRAHLLEVIADELALEPLLTRIVESACVLIGADDGSIGLYERERDLIRIAAVYRMPAREIGAEIRRGTGLAGRVLETGEAVLSRYGDVPNPTLAELADNHVLGLPVRRDGTLLGFIGIGARPPRRFDERDVEALGSFARHAAIAIHNASRYAHERRRTARFELIARIASGLAAGPDLTATLQKAADAIHEILDYPNVDIPLYDPLERVLVVQVRGGSYKRVIAGVDRIPIERGVMGAAVRERRAQLVNDVARDPRYVTPPGVKAPVAELAVPIVLHDEVLGVVNVEGEAPFDELDLASLEVVADCLAVAITNARLVEQAREAAVLAERHRLARELHDNVTQVLSSINLLAQTLVPVWRRDAEEGTRRVARLTELTQIAFAEMRALLHELRPPERAAAISKGGRAFLGLEQLREHALPGALTRLLAAMVPESLELRLDFAGYEPQRLEHEEALFRVCQEAVSNAIRHAHARRLHVTAAVHDAHVMLIVGDDGRGIGRGHAPGIGLRSMAERMRAHGGELRVAARSPRGTQVEARLPRADRAMG